jgi:hypothetical protein
MWGCSGVLMKLRTGFDGLGEVGGMGLTVFHFLEAGCGIS